MLGPFLCGLLTQAPLLPKLRGYFAEFLNNASPVGLRILSSSTCVGLRYGYVQNNSGFSWQSLKMLPTMRSPRYSLSSSGGFSSLTIARLHRSLHSRLCLRLPCPRISYWPGYRNIYLLSIGYAFPPRLRSRLPQGRSALPWKPWIFGLGDSHPHLATHSGILSS